MVRARMKVAFYLDTPDLTVIAELAISAVRKVMPDAEIWHLTTLAGPSISADKCLRMDVAGEFAYRQAIISAEMTGDVLFLDVDVIVREDVSVIFEQDFEVAVTTDMKPGAPGLKYNGGIIFSRCPAYWRTVAEAGKGMDFRKTPGDWDPIERMRNAVAGSGKFKLLVLPGEEYNYVPANASDIGGKIMHYRGNRKIWMNPIKGFESVLNTKMITMISQAETNMARDLPLFIEIPEHEGMAMIVGGAPSLNDELKNLRTHKNRGGVIFAMNGTHDWLIERGIVPDFHVLLDARQENVQFVQKPHKDVTYLVAAQCHPDIFDALEGHKVTMWAACFDTREQESDLCTKFPGKPIFMVGGGATVGLKTLNLAYLWGFRKIRMYGMDSSYSGAENHAYRQELNDKESRMDIHAAGRDFICAPWMAKQAQEFQRQYRQLVGLGCRIKVIGDGLIPWIYQQLSKGAA
jgi:uncharacterized Rossmann fold enzyme